MACRTLVPQPGIEPAPSAVKAQSPNHWTTKEFPLIFILQSNTTYLFLLRLFHLFQLGPVLLLHTSSDVCVMDFFF